MQLEVTELLAAGVAVILLYMVFSWWKVRIFFMVTKVDVASFSTALYIY